MLERQFAQYVDRIACGLAGEGSETFGYDDYVSRDHDFGCGFCLWLSDEDDKEIGDDLREAYLALPHSFLGYSLRDPCSYGVQRLSAMRISDYYIKFTGHPRGPHTLLEWIRIPENFLAAATSGEVFADPSGEFSAIRGRLLSFYPDDVRLCLIAWRAFMMGQAGQYNFFRSLSRGDNVAASLALARFCEAACSITYLLARRYMPYYKWAHRGLKDISMLSDIYDLLSALLCDETPARRKVTLLEDICSLVIAEFKRQKLSESGDSFMVSHCPCIREQIEDERIRNYVFIGE
jgi:hypothetical protein